MKKIILPILILIFASIICSKPEQIFAGNPEIPPKPKDKGIFFWRGRRLPRTSGDFSVRFVKTSKINGEFMRIDFIFSSGIDPRSVNAESIKIDEKSIPKETRFKFSRRGDILRIVVPHKSEFSLNIDGVKSFDGKKMLPLKINSLQDESNLRLFPPLPPPKKIKNIL